MTIIKVNLDHIAVLRWGLYGSLTLILFGIVLVCAALIGGSEVAGHVSLVALFLAVWYLHVAASVRIGAALDRLSGDFCLSDEARIFLGMSAACCLLAAFLVYTRKIDAGATSWEAYLTTWNVFPVYWAIQVVVFVVPRGYRMIDRCCDILGGKS